MGRLDWDTSWEMGDARLDAQHRAMIRAINGLETQIHEGRGPEAVNKAISFLMMYVETHFREEERCMERTGYPDRLAHARQHQSCARRIEGLLDSWRNGDEDILKDLVTFFSYWLAEHLGGADLRFSAFLREQGAPDGGSGTGLTDQ